MGQRAITSIKWLFFSTVLFLICGIPAYAKNDFSIIQTDIKAPSMDLYIDADQNIDPDDVSIKIKNSDLSFYVKEAEKVKDTGIGTKYYIILDISTSVPEDVFASLKKDVKEFTDQLKDKDDIELITFGRNVETYQGTKKVKSALDSLKQENKTHLYQGITGLSEEICSDKKQYIDKDSELRQLAMIITDWQEIKTAGGQNSREEALLAMQKTNVPLYGFCLSHASVKLQDDMGAFIRSANGSFREYKEGSSLKNLMDERSKDVKVTVELSSGETSSDGMSMDVTIGKVTETKDNVYITFAENDEEAPVISDVKEADQKDTLILVFSEAVSQADNKNNYTVTEGEKNSYPVSEATYQYEDGKYQTTLIFNKKLAKGHYKIETTNITDSSDNHNPMEEAWTGDLNGQGTIKRVFAALGKVWPLLVLLIILVILLVIYLVIKKNKGIMVVEDKLTLGDNISTKQHIKKDDENTKYISIDVHGVAGDTREIDLQVISSAIFGRSSINDVYFDDLNMSKQHFALEIDQGHVLITDLDSQNGTFVNNNRIYERTEIISGDVIEAGNVRMTMRWE